MKRKYSFLIDIVVICLCVCAIAIGVFSATTASLTVSGSIGFQAHNCELEVNVSKQGHAYEGDLTQYYTNPQYIDFDPSEEKNETGILGGNDATITGPINLGTMTFTDIAENTIPPIIVKATVTNKSAYKVSGFVTVDVAEDSNVFYTRQYSLVQPENIYNHSSAIILDIEESATFIISFKVKNIDQPLDPSKAISIKGEFAKYDKTQVKEFDDENNNLRYTPTTSDTSAYYTVTTISKVKDEIEILPEINHIPVTQIAESAFLDYTSLASTLTIPNSITNIGNDAFRNCSGLTGNLIIPDSVTSLGNNAFRNCSGFNGNLVISNNLISIGNNAFQDCSSLTGGLTIPKSVTTIGGAAFLSCTNLVSLKISNGVKTILWSAFNKCSNLISVNIPASVESIGDWVFSGCINLENLKVNPNNAKFYSQVNGVEYNCIIDNSNNALISGCKNTIIPNTVSTIKGFAFERQTLLTSIKIPNSVTRIEANAFVESGITSVEFENTTGWWVTEDKSATIGGVELEIYTAQTAQNATNLKLTYLKYYWNRT